MLSRFKRLKIERILPCNSWIRHSLAVLESCEEMPQVMYARLFQKTRPEMGAAEEESLRRSHGICRTGFAHRARDRMWALIDRSPRRISTPSKPFIASTRRLRRWIYVPCTGRKCSRCSKSADMRSPNSTTCCFESWSVRKNFPSAGAGCAIRRSFPTGSRRRRRDRRERILSRRRARGFPRTDRAASTRWTVLWRLWRRVEGKLVACGTGLVIPEHRVFALCGAGTLADSADAACRPPCCGRAWRPQLRPEASTP